MSEAILILGVARTAKGFKVLDGQNEHEVRTEAELGTLIARLTTDENLPRAESVAPVRAKVRKAAVQIARNVIPARFSDAPEPLVDLIEGFASFVARKIKEPPKPKTRGPSPARRKPMPTVRQVP